MWVKPWQQKGDKKGGSHAQQTEMCLRTGGICWKMAIWARCGIVSDKTMAENTFGRQDLSLLLEIVYCQITAFWGVVYFIAFVGFFVLFCEQHVSLSLIQLESSPFSLWHGKCLHAQFCQQKRKKKNPRGCTIYTKVHMVQETWYPRDAALTHSRRYSQRRWGQIFVFCETLWV